MAQHMTARGLEQLVAEEGEVLTAYRDRGGVWTIGVGLTAASGVIAPKAGMRITQAESRVLLAQALALHYEPAVARVMPDAEPHEFDAAVSFHFNTGANRTAVALTARPLPTAAEIERRYGAKHRPAAQR